MSKLIFSNDGVSATIEDGCDYAIEIANLLFSSLNFCPTTAKGMSGGARWQLNCFLGGRR